MKTLAVLIFFLCQSAEDARLYVEEGHAPSCVSVSGDPEKTLFNLVKIEDALDTEHGVVYVGEVEQPHTGYHGWSAGRLELLLY